MAHEIEQRIPAMGIQTVSINGRDGDVTVTWTTGEEIVVRGEQIEIDEHNGEATIAQEPREGFLGLLGTKGIEVELPETIAEVRIAARRGDVRLEGPRGDVNAKLDHGDIRARGGSGELALRLGAGDCRVDAYQGPVSIQTGAGDVSLIGIDGALTIQSGAGDITVRGGSGDVNLKSGAGDCEVLERDCDELSLKTGTGDVTIRGGQTRRTSIQSGLGDVGCTAMLGLGHHSVITGAGDVTLSVPRELPARIEVTTVHGEVESDIPLVTVGKRGPRSLFGRRLVGSTGEGEPRAEITVRTGKGDVAVRWLAATAALARPVVPAPPPAPSAPPSPPAPPAAATPGATNGAEPTPGTGEPAADVPAATAPGDSNLEAEERAILSELAAGALTVEEADYLLAALAQRRTA